jgi:uncharacterized protein
MNQPASNQKNILITGGTGLVGKALSQHLIQQGYTVTILTRSKPATALAGVQYALWNVEKNQIDTDAVCKAFAIVHLAGAGVVDKRWSATYKEKIRRSRTDSGDLLCRTLANNTHQCQIFVAASAIGWYGADGTHTPDGGFVESAAPATDFLGSTCQQWEASVAPISQLGIRLVHYRIGIVLSTNGGALVEFLKPLRMGVAAILGSGNQVVSWVHIADICQLISYAILHPISGTYNAVAPAPVSNKQLTLTLAKITNGKWYLPFKVPAWLLGIVMGESSIEVLKSCTVSSKKIKASGYTFQYPEIAGALRHLMA